MTIDPTEQLTAQIERYDQMQKDLGDGFNDKVINEQGILSFAHSFDAVLSHDPRITAVANLGFKGDIEEIVITSEDDRGTFIHIDEGSGLWAAMQAWLDDFRDAAWEEV